jgi:hypothetical protein
MNNNTISIAHRLNNPNSDISENDLRRYIYNRALNILSKPQISNMISNETYELKNTNNTNTNRNSTRVANWALNMYSKARHKANTNKTTLRKMANRIKKVASQTNPNNMLSEINKNVVI